MRKSLLFVISFTTMRSGATIEKAVSFQKFKQKREEKLESTI